MPGRWPFVAGESCEIGEFFLERRAEEKAAELCPEKRDTWNLTRAISSARGFNT